MIVLLTFLSVTGAFVTLVFYVRYQLLNFGFSVDRRMTKSAISAEEIETISAAQVDELSTKLAAFLDNEKPDCILGVNTGGRLLSVLLCEKNQWNPEKCAYVTTSDLADNRPRLTQLRNRLSGKIIVVDDITRRGATLELVNSYLVRESVSKNMEINGVKFATLAVSASYEKTANPYFLPHWYGMSTGRQMASFPWSPLSTWVNESLRSRSCGSSFDQSAIDFHRKIESSHKFALKCARLSLKENSNLLGDVKDLL